MNTFTMESAKNDFEGLFERAREGLLVYVIGDDGHEYKLSLERMPVNKPRKAGSARGTVWMSEDFDAPMPELKPYME